jgi:uncharacterized protein YjiS (DUF1127 family)
MTDITVRLSGTSSGFRQIAVSLERSLSQAIMARSLRRALHELPAAVLEDMGLTRSEISFVADALVSGQKGVARNVIDRLNWTGARPSAT